MEIEITSLRIRIGEAEFDLTMEQAQELYEELGSVFGEDEVCENENRDVFRYIPERPVYWYPQPPYIWTSDNSKNPFPYIVKITTT